MKLPIEFGVRRDGDAVVHKFPLEFDDDYIARTEIRGTILHAGRDPQGVLCVWAIVWPEIAPTARRRIVLVGTGHPMPAGTWAHLATLHEGGLVLHLFVGP